MKEKLWKDWKTETEYWKNDGIVEEKINISFTVNSDS